MKTRQILTGLILILSLVSMTPGSASCAVLHIEPNGVNDPGRDGLSWATAFATINYAVTRVSSGDTILVSNGVYNVTAAVAFGDRVLTIESLNGSAHTILDGGGSASGTFHAFSAGTDSTLRGFTMTNFYLANGTVSVWGSDRVMYIYDCVFSGNSANVGGGICIGSGATAYVYDCVISGNYARGGDGAGIYLYASSPLYVYNTDISDNTSPADGWNRGGAIFMREGGILELEKCRIFENNSPDGSGAGILSYFAVGSLIVKDCVISGNYARRGSGGAYIVGANARISNTVIKDNFGDGRCGGIRLSDGIIENSLITGNSAGTEGGGAHLINAIMRNCTVVSNSGGYNAWTRGGLYATGSDSQIINSVVYFNFNAQGGVYSNYLTSDTLYFRNSLTGPDPEAYGKGVDCTTEDPMFGPAPDNFKPLHGSPAINAGTNDIWMIGVRDLDRYSRIGEGIVDIGAYEYHPPGAVIQFW